MEFVGFFLESSVMKVPNASLDNPSQMIEQYLFNLETSTLILSPGNVSQSDYILGGVVKLERGTHPILGRNSCISCNRDCTLDVRRWNRAQSAW